MATVTTPTPGTLVVGKYRVERELGSGGMGTVVEATHLALNQRVAIKLLSPELADSPEILARFLREARIAAQLPSEHIARVIDIGQTEVGMAYLVMELLVGHDVATEMAHRGRLPIVEAVDLILQACEGLADAHAANLVHRDLKPANLFLAQRRNKPPILKILDFGLSKAPKASNARSITDVHSVFGTPQYMSPEQIRSAKLVDARTDQHALAMILYEMLTGVPAYEGETPTAVMVAISSAPPPHVSAILGDVPAPLDQAIARALAKNPDQRFRDIAEFAMAICPFGPPNAREMADAVSSALMPTANTVPFPSSETPRATSPPSDLLTTIPLGMAQQSHTDLTSSIDPFRQMRRKQRMVVLIGAAIAVLVVVALILIQGSSNESTVTPARSFGVYLASIRITLPPPPTPSSSGSPSTPRKTGQ